MHRPTRRLRALLFVSLAACGPQRVLDEGAHAVDVEPAEPIDDPVARAGNFPEPAITTCGQLPPGIEPADALASAWAVQGERAYADVDPGVVRLRLAAFGFGPDEPADGPDGDCRSEIGWMFAFDLPSEFLAPGVYPLSTIIDGYAETYESFADGGCGAGRDDQGGAPLSDAGELEIYAVDGACIVGELRGAQPEEGPNGELLSLHDGGFVAMRAVSACVPMLGYDC